MVSLLIGGAQSVGKSETIYRLANRLIARGFIVVAGSVPVNFSDFRAVVERTNNEGKTTRIIINSPTDTIPIITNFKDFYNANGSYDILISSIRDYNFYPRQEFFKIMGIVEDDNVLEFPMGKITRRGGNFNIALGWYQNKIDKLIDSILSKSPFGIN